MVFQKLLLLERMIPDPYPEPYKYIIPDSVSNISVVIAVFLLKM
jgi:hypothetical protein